MENSKEKGYHPDKDETGFNSFYDEFHFLMGKIVVNINLLESKMLMMICNLTDPKDILVGFAICKRKGVSQLLELLTDLIRTKVKNEEIIKEYDKLHIELKEIIKHRNTYIHSVYLDSTNLDIKLSRKIGKVRRIGMREFGKGQKSIESSIIYELTPLRAIVQWLDSLYEETDEFVHLLSKELPMFQVTFSVPEEPGFLKKK